MKGVGGYATIVFDSILSGIQTSAKLTDRDYMHCGKLDIALKHTMARLADVTSQPPSSRKNTTLELFNTTLAGKGKELDNHFLKIECPAAGDIALV